MKHEGRSAKRPPLQKYKTREEWLNAALDVIREWAAELDYTLPDEVRVSIGFPSKGALAKKSQRIGECWASVTSGDKHAEIFITPLLADPVRMLDVLVHEAVHAIMGHGVGHKAPFKRCATALGLTGQMTATVAGPELRERLEKLNRKLGVFPGAPLTGSNGKKKQSTRMLKVECPSCGYVVRTTAKWLEHGTPTCACGTPMEEAA